MISSEKIVSYRRNWKMLVASACVVFAALLLLAVLSPANAHADVKNASMKVGQSWEPFKKVNDNLYKSPSIKSSNSNVVACIYDFDDSDEISEFTLVAKGFGTAKVTATWKYQMKTYSKVFNIKVKEGRIVKKDCDYLFTKKSYTVTSLFKQVKEDEHTAILSKQKSGKFLKGKGYKVTSKGKKITFTKTGAKTVKYKYKSKTYKIKVSTVHSKSQLLKKVIKTIKYNAYYPSSFKLQSATLSSRGKLKVRYTIKNAYGRQNMKVAFGSYDDGKYDFDSDYDDYDDNDRDDD